MLSHVLYKEFSESIMSLEAIEEFFPRYNVQFVYSTVVESCKARGFFINEYTILALVLDIIISIDRIKRHFGLSERALYENSGDEQLLVLDIIRRIEEHFHITYDRFESSELAVIIAGNLIKSNQGSISMNSIRQFVDPLCAGLIDPLGEQLANYDFIDMNNARFMPRFILHINNLVLRLKNRYARKNPLTGHIKTSCPMLFDCAVELSDLIRQKTGYSAGEDETAYIALHIGSLLNSHSDVKDKVRALLIFPQYYDYGTKLIDQLTESFHASLVIQDVVTHAGSPVPETSSVDLVITVMDMPHFFEAEYVCINPFMSDRDFEAVRQSIIRVKQKKKRVRLLRELEEISHPDIFFANKAFAAGDECIRFMAEKMTSLGYAEDTFVDEVLSRESSYSTRYGSLAVPHSMRLNAKKTGMAVLINEKPVPWGDGGTVNMVFLFSIHKQTRSLFYDIFDNLMVLLLEEENVDKIRNARTHEAFIRAIMDCL
jgi:lichenan operon transcriptional antiterminator